jgi:Tol biopolymer transport system component
VKDLKSGRETLLAATPFPDWFPIFSPDGSRVAFTAQENGRYPVYVISRGTASPDRLCDDCGVTSDWSPDGKRVMIFTNPDTTDAHLSVLDVSLRQVTRLAGGSGRRLYGLKLRPGGEWAAFLEIKPSSFQIYLAPVRDLSERNWIRVASGSVEDKPQWSSDGRFLYFVSQRDGFRCIWARPFNPKAPGEGEPFPVLHSHQARRSMGNVPLASLRIATAPGRLVFSLNEWSANIWMATVTR